MKEVEFGKTSTHIHGEGKRGNSKTTLEGNAKTWNEPIPTLLKQHKQRLVPFKSTLSDFKQPPLFYFTDFPVSSVGEAQPTAGHSRQVVSSWPRPRYRCLGSAKSCLEVKASWCSSHGLLTLSRLTKLVLRQAFIGKSWNRVYGGLQLNVVAFYHAKSCGVWVHTPLHTDKL